MDTRTRTFSLALFAVGVALGLFLATTAVWADQETLNFEFGIRPDEALTTLDCPVWLMKDETGVVKMTYSNPGERNADPLVRVSISAGRIDSVRELEIRKVIPPGETESYQWEFTAADAVYNRFVMMRVYTFRSGSLAALGASCGVFVLPLPGKYGRPIAMLTLVSSLGFMGLGFLLFWQHARREVESKHYVLQAMGLLGVIVSLALFTGMNGFWVFGWVLIIIGVLTLLTLLSYLLLK